MKKTVVLNENTKRLLAYSSAAGLGAIAAGRTAQADVFLGTDNGFSPFTLTSIYGISNPANSVPIDIDLDGTNDLSFTAYSAANSSFDDSVQVVPLDPSVQILTRSPLNYGRANSPVGSFGVGNRLDANDPAVNLMQYPLPFLALNDDNAGPILDNNGFPLGGPRDYLGVQGSSGNYGWVRFEIDLSTFQSPTIAVQQFAYDDTGLGITVPEPSTLGLGLLALGALGMNVRRHRKAC